MKVKRKKGEIYSNVFVYITGIIIISLIFLFGFKLVKDIGKKNEQSSLIQFKNQLRNDIKGTGEIFGSEKIRRYELPGNINEICLVDLKNVDPNNLNDRGPIKDSVQSMAKDNIFLFGKEGVDSFDVENLELSKDPFYYCIKSKRGIVEIKMNGTGIAAKIIIP